LQRTGIASESVRSGDLAYLESPSAEKNTTSRIGKLLPECVALLAFATLVAATIPWHEPFADEAQAWQLARTFSLPELFQTYIRYEAAPGLWHFLLWIFIRLHVSYSGLHWICGAIATLAAAVLLFKAPFPRYLRLSLPFTYYLLFQYAVVARNYVLAPLLMFLIAACWRKSPLIVAVLLGLLANVSLHAATISGGFAILFLLEQLRSSDGRRERKTLLIWGALVVLCLYALAIWTAWPPHDLPLSRFRGVSRPIVTATIGALTVGICDPWLLGFVFWIAVAVCLRARRRMLYLLPAGLFAVFSGFAYYAWWHLGLLFLTTVCIFWITWPADGAKPARAEIAGRAALVYMVVCQILWAGYALWLDRTQNYSPDAATARFLAPFVQNHATVVVTHSDRPDPDAFNAVGIEPYFDHNIFANWTTPFWWWSRNNGSEEKFAELLTSRPQIVVVEARVDESSRKVDMNQPTFLKLERSGYRATNLFCGSMPFRLGTTTATCHVIFQPQSAAPSPH
jgi:hypothetical protein